MHDPLLLIHGAWQGSWVWEALLPHLENLGMDAVAIDLPGNGADDTKPGDVSMETYLGFIENQLNTLGDRAVLVGHSGGGMVATAAAERFPDRVSALIYIAGMCLPQGTDFGELQERIAGPGGEFGISSSIRQAPDQLTSTVPVDAAVQFFLHDVDSTVAKAAALRLTPQPEGGRFITSPTTADNYGRVPKLYIEATLDRSVILPAQRLMQSFVPDMTVVSIESGHVPQVGQPANLAALISQFLDGLVDSGH